MATIRVPESLKRRLAERRQRPKESLAKVIERVLDEDDEAHLDLSGSSKAAIRQGRKDIRAGRLRDIEQVRTGLGL